MGLSVSRLCLADKLAFAITPGWLYIPMARWTGELAEYMQRSKERQSGDPGFTPEEMTLLKSGDPYMWLHGLQSYTLRWVEQHRTKFAFWRTGRPWQWQTGGCFQSFLNPVRRSWCRRPERWRLGGM